MGGRVIAAVGVAFAMGCSVLVGEGFSGGPAPDPDASTTGNPLDAALADGTGTGDDGGADASTDSDANDGGSTCLLTAIEALDVTPPIEAGIATCNVSNVLVEDGIAAGLAQSTPNEPSFAGEKVSSCIGVRFPSAVSALRIVARLIKNACGIGTGCATCATQVNAKIFAGPTFDAVTSIGIQGIESDPDGGHLEKRYVLPSNVSHGPAIVVCRDGVGQGEADILVDAIIGECP